MGYCYFFITMYSIEFLKLLFLQLKENPSKKPWEIRCCYAGSLEGISLLTEKRYTKDGFLVPLLVNGLAFG